ncbi:MAG TPA: LuxR C-terminal-related transcriptional regulator, partial [Rugosimonospora sp.]
RGDALLSPAATRSLIARFLRYPDHADPPTPQRLAVLTDRERGILVLVAGGLSNDEIAQHLVLSPATVKTHVNRAMVKLAARDRAQLVVIAYQTGLVRPVPE